MELNGRPLFDNPLDFSLFVPRDETARIEANCRDGVNTLVYGDRGAGKTSLMRHLLFNLREREYPAVGVDAAPAESAVDLIRLVAVALGRLRFQGAKLNTHAVAGLGEVGSVLDEVRALRPVGEDEEGPRTVILVDLPSGAEDAHQLFGRFRDELWQLPYTWVVFIPKGLRIELLTPPADAFFEDVIGLGPLTPAQQEEMIERRLGSGEKTPWRIPTEEEGNPRRLLEMVRESIRKGAPPDRHLEARAKRERAVASLGRPASMMYAELENYGPASASDGELLQRLGWSRQRAAQVFKELERAGFVRAERQHGEGGRPRKVFAIAPLDS